MKKILLPYIIKILAGQFKQEEINAKEAIMNSLMADSKKIVLALICFICSLFLLSFSLIALSALMFNMSDLSFNDQLKWGGGFFLITSIILCIICVRYIGKRIEFYQQLNGLKNYSQKVQDKSIFDPILNELKKEHVKMKSNKRLDKPSISYLH